MSTGSARSKGGRGEVGARSLTPASSPLRTPTRRHGRTPHLAQLKDAPQRGPHQAGLGLLQGLLLLQLPHELQSPGPALPARVDQAWAGRGPSGAGTREPRKMPPRRVRCVGPRLPWVHTGPRWESSPGPLTVGRVGGCQVGGGTAVDDGVCGHVGEVGQGCHQHRGVCGGRRNRTLTPLPQGEAGQAAHVLCPQG